MHRSAGGPYNVGCHLPQATQDGFEVLSIRLKWDLDGDSVGVMAGVVDAVVPVDNVRNAQFFDPSIQR